MRKWLTIAILTVIAPMLSGCVAAIVPALAAGALGASRVDGDDKVGGTKQAGVEERTEAGVVAEAAIAVAQAPKSDRSTDVASSPRAAPVSGDAANEASALLRPAPHATSGGYSPYSDLLSHVERQVEMRASSGMAAGAVLVPRVDLDAPETIACGTKPFAVIVDLDGKDGPAFGEAGSLQPQPGLAEALGTMRAQHVRIAWISDAARTMAPAMRSILEISGLSSPSDGDIFLLKGGDENRKQLRRQEVASDHCVLAIVGDDYDDFDELYDYLLYPEAAAPLDDKFGNGWFLTPPPFAANAARAATSNP